jgi:hypothetical protein
MYARLYNLWVVDHRARWHLYVSSIVIAFGYGVVNNLLLGRPEDRVTWETLGLLCATVSALTIFYCTRTEEKMAERESDARTRRDWLVPVFAGAAVVIAGLFLRPRLYKYQFTGAENLATIRATVQTAEAKGTVLPSPQIAEYRREIRATPSSAAEYWTTVAAIVNYQSLVNQLSGQAPDPAKVAKRCGEFGQNAYDNRFLGGRYPDCVVYLDSNTFENVIFQDSVIHYRGGPVSLSGVTFINCRFLLELTAQPTTPVQKNLLLAMLDSSDQKTIQIPGS